MTLVFGELLPKRIAIRDPEKVAFAVCGSLKFFYSLFKPLVWLVSKTVNAIANAFGVRETDNQSEYTEEEIRTEEQTNEEEQTMRRVSLKPSGRK